MAAEDYIGDWYDDDDNEPYAYNYDAMWPNHGVSIVKGDRKMKVENKFYCGAREILTNGWAKKTEKEAIEHAYELLEEAREDSYGPSRDHVVIVKIIKVVRRRREVVRQNYAVENVE